MPSDSPQSNPATTRSSGIDLRDRPLLFGLLIATSFFLVAAGIIHVLAAGVHADHAIGHGVFFASVGVMQILVAIFLFARPDRLGMVLAAAATGGILLLWTITLFAPTPFGEEELDIYAITSKVAELAGFGTLLAFGFLSRPPRESSVGGAAAGASAGVVALLLIGSAIVSAGGMYGFGLGVEPLFPDDWVHDHDHDHDHHHHNGHDHDHNGHGHDDHGHGDHDHHQHGDAPAVHLLVGPVEGVVPLTVNFTAHVGGLHGNATWTFDAGDGNVTSGTPDDFQEDFAHTYEQVGEFTAVFRVEHGNQSAEDFSLVTVSPPEPMQASWEFGGADGCPELLVLPLPCDGHDINLADERYQGLAFTASAAGTLAGDLTIDFLDADGEVIESGGTSGTIPAGAVSAFLYTEGPSTSSTFDVELPPNVPEA